MFCIYCGTSMPEEAKFCPKCGKTNSQIKNATQKYIQPYAERGEPIDHDILVLYLEQLCVMETSVKFLCEEEYKIQQKITKLGYTGNKNIIVPQKPQTGVYGEAIAYFVGFIGFFVLIFIISIFLQRYANMRLLEVIITLFAVIIIGLVAGLVYAVNKKDSVDQLLKNKYELNMEKFRKELENDRLRIKQEQKEKEKLLIIEKEIASERKRAENILGHYYEVDYIPKPYRNIKAVYYLYDYISSSLASLDTALLHLRLEMIEEKINILIRQNAIKILQNAIIISQNEKLIDQNNEILQRAIGVEKNATKIAQYTEISVAYTESIKYIEEVMTKYVE